MDEIPRGSRPDFPRAITGNPRNHAILPCSRLDADHDASRPGADPSRLRSFSIRWVRQCARCGASSRVRSTRSGSRIAMLAELNGKRFSTFHKTGGGDPLDKHADFCRCAGRDDRHFPLASSSRFSRFSAALGVSSTQSQLLELLSNVTGSLSGRKRLARSIALLNHGGRMRSHRISQGSKTDVWAAMVAAAACTLLLPLCLLIDPSAR